MDNAEAAGTNPTCALLYDTQFAFGAAVAATTIVAGCKEDLGHTAWLTGRMSDNSFA